MGLHNFRKTQHRSNGFTLIEAIVVLVILGVLAAVLWPIFLKAKEEKLPHVCGMNLKQIGLGLMQYSEDNDRRYPPLFNGHLNPENLHKVVSWRTVVEPYIKFPEIWKCNWGSTANPNRYYNSPYDGLPLSYDVTNTGPIRQGKPVAEKQVKSPDATIIVFEENGNNAQSQQIGVLWDHDAGEVGWTNILFAGHMGGSNYLFADGHVKWLKPLDTIGQGVNRWHLNNYDPVSPRAMQKLQSAQRNFAP